MPEWLEWHFVEGVLYQHVPPHLFFTSDQIKVWKNMAHWGEDEWVTLPGPAEWWPEEYNFEKHGWIVGEAEMNQELVFSWLFQKEIPKEQNQI
ncbi:MAG: hypothetical protein M1837_001103 [Sclerophora amabilis]|nr:MAG: hypothetical protein M1837_001103 [Sclerophora amabilis]